MNVFGQSVGLLGRGIGPTQGFYLHKTTKHTQKNADIRPCLEWVSNPRSQCLSGQRQYVPQPLGHWDRPVCIRSILILSSSLHLDLQSGLFTSGFRTKILYTFLISSMHTTCPAHLTLLHLTTPNDTSYEAPHYVVFSSLLNTVTNLRVLCQ
jgi:hypothetical protein